MVWLYCGCMGPGQKSLPKIPSIRTGILWGEYEENLIKMRLHLTPPAFSDSDLFAMSEVLFVHNGCTFARLICLLRQIRQFQDSDGGQGDRYFQQLVSSLDERASIALYQLLKAEGLIDSLDRLELDELAGIAIAEAIRPGVG